MSRRFKPRHTGKLAGEPSLAIGNRVSANLDPGRIRCVLAQCAAEVSPLDYVIPVTGKTLL